MDPDFNGNWKGTIGAIAVSIGILNWINSNASGIEGQGPTNLDLLMAINKWVQDSNSKKGADANTGKMLIPLNPLPQYVGDAAGGR